MPALATTAILTSSAIPLRTWSSGRVSSSEKSSSTFWDAW